MPGRDNCGDFGGVFARNRGMGLVYVRGCHNLVKVGTINNIVYSHIYSFYEGNPYSPSLSTESIRVFSTTLELFSPKSWEVKRDCFPVSFFYNLEVGEIFGDRLRVHFCFGMREEISEG